MSKRLSLRTLVSAPLLLAFGFVYWLLVLRLDLRVLTPELDTSWRRLIAFDFLHEMRAGVDFVFTYGPLGYFTAPQACFVPELFDAKFWAECVGKGLVVLALLLPVTWIRGWWRPVLYCVLLVLTVPVSYDALHLLAICATAVFVLQKRVGPRWVYPLSLPLAALSMAKFTYFTFGGLAIVVLVVHLWRRSGWKLALGFVATHVAVFCLLWFAIGQSVATIPAWVRGSLQISSGYNEWRYPGPGEDAWHALVGALLVGCAILQHSIRGRRRFQQLGTGLLLLGMLYLTWKSGIIRQDGGHLLLFFSVAALIPLWCDSPAFGRSWPASFGAALPLVAVIAGLAGVLRRGTDIGYEITAPYPRLEYHATTSWRILHNKSAFEQLSQALLDKSRLEHDLPRVRAFLAKRAEEDGAAPTIDQVPHDQGYLFLNGFHVRHRPVFQSYSACTPYLQDLNARFYESEQAPDFVLFRLCEIDEKMPLVGDSQIYRVLLARYAPVLAERGMFLMRRLPEASFGPPRSAAKELSDTWHQLGDWIELERPEGLLLISLRLEPSLLGRVRGFLFRPARLYLTVRDETGAAETHDISKIAMREPFLLSPKLRRSSDFGKLYLGSDDPGTKPARITSLQLRSKQGEEIYFAPKFELVQYGAERPRTGMAAPTVQSELRRLDFPAFVSLPQSWEPAANFYEARAGEQSVMFAHAPCTLQFALESGKTRVRGGFGFMPGTEKGSVPTDGAEFRIVATYEGQEPRIVFQRVLDPVATVEDRAPQSFDFVVEGGEAATGTLRFEILERGHNSCDWTYWTGIELARE